MPPAWTLVAVWLALSGSAVLGPEVALGSRKFPIPPGNVGSAAHEQRLGAGVGQAWGLRGTASHGG